MSSAVIYSEDNDITAKSIVEQLKSQGIFDEFRRECLSDVDTKPSFMNLRQRTEGYVSRFLSQQQWSSMLNKNQLRESLRRQINESGMVKFGVEHLAEQVITPKVKTTFYPRIDSLVKQLLGIKDEETCDDNIWPEEEGEKSEDSQFVDEVALDKTNKNTTNKVNAAEVDDTTKSYDVSQKFKTSDDINDRADTGASGEKLLSKTSFHDATQTADDTNAQKELLGQSLPISEKNKVTEAVKRKVHSIQKIQPADDRYLSDVSSVHTSDLSDFDDRISLSSDEDDIKERVKISLKKVKQMTSVASVIKDTVPSSTDDSDSNSKMPKKEHKLRTNKNYATESKQRNETIKAEDLKNTEQCERNTKMYQREEPSEDNTESSHKPRRKLLKQRSETQNQQRYDASDLYKPRPVIASRRNRISASDSGI